MMNQALSYKDYFDMLESIVMTIALIIGGVWSYRLFIQKRQKYPRAHIQHTISHHDIGSGQILLNVNVTITNDSDVLLRIACGVTYIRLVVPSTAMLMTQPGVVDSPTVAQRHGWPLLAYQNEESVHLNTAGLLRRVTETISGRPRCIIELEPHEHEQLFYPFIIDRTSKTILVETFFSNWL